MMATEEAAEFCNISSGFCCRRFPYLFLPQYRNFCLEGKGAGKFVCLAYG